MFNITSNTTGSNKTISDITSFEYDYEDFEFGVISRSFIGIIFFISLIAVIVLYFRSINPYLKLDENKVEK